jgi:hypothetical protein
MADTKQPLAAGRGAVDLAIIAKGGASLTAAELAAIRQHALDRFPSPLRPQFLKHSDDQTLAALVALSAAIETHDMARDYHDWAIVSSTRYLGRAQFAAVIDKYRIDGPWGVSVQVIPHTAPHALAGTVSLALGSHGPSIGAGAAREEESQALLAAATLLQTPDVRGAWIVLSGWSAEQQQPGASEAACATTCTAAVLAVVLARTDASQENRAVGRIVIEPCQPEQIEAAIGQRSAAPLAELLAGHTSNDLHWEKTRCGMRTRIELAAAELSSQLGVPRAA